MTRTPVDLPPLGDAPVISVVIPARDAAATLPDAVGAVLGQDPPPDEIIIAVGASGDGTERQARSLADRDPRVRVIVNPTGRTPDGLNAAIDVASGQVIVRVDAHAFLPPGYIATALDALRRTGAANVGGVQVPTADRGFASAVAAAMRSPMGSGGAAYRSGARAGPTDTAYLGVFHRGALDAVGGFDPRLTRNQDAELNLRLRRAGFEVWLEPSLRVAYRPRASLRALARQYLEYGRWRRLTARVHPGSLRLRQLAAPVLIVGLAGASALSMVLGTMWPIGAAAGGYLVVLALAATHAAPSLKLTPATVLALATMHLAWGIGFLIGPPRGGTRFGDDRRAAA